MKKLYLVLGIVFIITSSFSQNTKKFVFQARNGNFVDTNYVSDFNKKRGFTIDRETLNDSTFIDSPILCQGRGKECSVKYRKLSNGNWLIYGNEKWNLFYDNKKKMINRFKASKDSIFFLPKGVNTTLKDKLLYEFEVKNLSYIEPENNLVYLFSPDDGIVGIITPSINLIRTDIIEVKSAE